MEEEEIIRELTPDEKRKLNAEYMKAYREKKKLEAPPPEEPGDKFKSLIFKLAMKGDNPKWADLWERLSRDERGKKVEYSLTADDLFRIRREAAERVRQVSMGDYGDRSVLAESFILYDQIRKDSGQDKPKDIGVASLAVPD